MKRSVPTPLQSSTRRWPRPSFEYFIVTPSRDLNSWLLKAMPRWLNKARNASRGSKDQYCTWPLLK